jgi:alpha-tubulin suppressor-like RCC1 family protein
VRILLTAASGHWRTSSLASAMARGAGSATRQRASYNGFGAVGIGNFSDANFPQPVKFSTGSPVTGAAAIAAGLWHSVVLLPNATVLAFGNGVEGELGNGQTSSSATPVIVPILGGGNIAIGAGWTTSFVVNGNGTSLAWGEDTHGSSTSPALGTARRRR